MIRTVTGYLLAGTALLACPCHLPLTLPLALALLGGTALGPLLAARSELVIIAASVYFVAGLVLGWLLLVGRTSRLRPVQDDCGCPREDALRAPLAPTTAPQPSGEEAARG
jgi:mercuric ion transport protein